MKTKLLASTLAALFGGLLGVQGQLCSSNTNSLQFDGTSSYVSTSSGHDLDMEDEITVEAWIYPTAWGPTPVMNSIVCKHGWTAGEKGFVLRAGGSGQLSFTIAGIDNHGNNVSWKEVTSGTNELQLNAWQHVAGTYDGNKLKIFINGNQAGSLSFKGKINPSGYNLKIGRIADMGAANGRYFSGLIDEVRIWNDARSESDISGDMFNQVSTTFNYNLVGYWKFNDGSGTSANDIGTGNNNGTVHNATWNSNVAFTNGVTRPVITVNGHTYTSSSNNNNQWNHNGVPIQGETGHTFTPVSSGYYSVTASYGLGCTATSEEIYYQVLDVETTPSTELTYEINGKELRVHSGKPNQNLKVNIYDCTGRNLFNTKLGADPISLATVPSGIYFIAIESSEGNFKSRFFLQ